MIVQVQRTRAGAHPVVPIAAGDEGAQEK